MLNIQKVNNIIFEIEYSKEQKYLVMKELFVLLLSKRYVIESEQLADFVVLFILSKCCCIMLLLQQCFRTVRAAPILL